MADPGDATTPPTTPSRPATTGTTRPPSAPGARPTGPGLRPSSSTSLIGGDWPVQATTTVVDLVDQVKAKTTGPIMTAGRGAVHGLLAGVLGVVVLVLLLVAGVRFLDEVLPSGVWLAYLVLGVIFTIVGTLVFRKRHSAPSTTI